MLDSVVDCVLISDNPWILSCNYWLCLKHKSILETSELKDKYLSSLHPDILFAVVSIEQHVRAKVIAAQNNVQVEKKTFLVRQNVTKIVLAVQT